MFKIVSWAPKSGLRIRLFARRGPKKSLIGTRDLAHFLHGRCGLRIAFVKKARSYSANEDPRSDIFLFGKRTRGNSALHRSYITNSDGEWKNVKISVLGNIGFGAQTTRQLLQTFLVNFWGSGRPQTPRNSPTLPGDFWAPKIDENRRKSMEML